MSNKTKANIYVVGGPVQAADGIYISRKADNELLDLCRSRNFAYILTPRQMGKSSLMLRTAERLGEEGIRTVKLDLNEIGINVSNEEWYLGLLTIIEDQLSLDTDVVEWWQARTHLGMTQRLTLFFKDVLLTEMAEPVVIFVDEIDSTLALSFTDDFFAAIRLLYHNRAQMRAFHRLTFVLIGVATPSDLIKSKERTPFNIGQRVNLTDFTVEEALPLAAGLGLSPDESQQVLKGVIEWTSGHPYLTQHLCRTISSQNRDHWTKADVDGVVASTFFGEMSKQDNNLQFVRDMLTKREVDPITILNIYRDVLRNKRPVYDEEQSLFKSRLKLSGIVCPKDGALHVRNAIYRRVFDEKWIKDHLPVNWFKRAQRAAAVLISLVIFSLLPLSLYAFNRAEAAETQKVEAERLRIEAERQADIAVMEREEAMRLREIAEEQKGYAEAQKLIAEKRREEAERLGKLAEVRRKEEVGQREHANKQKLEAESLGVLANERSIEADKERQRAEELAKIALARQLGSQAQLLQSQQGNLLPRSLLLALESMERLETVEAQQALRQGLSVLPRPVLELSHDGPVATVVYSSDGKYLVTDTKLARAKGIISGSKITSEKGLPKSQAFQAEYNEGWREVLTEGKKKTLSKEAIRFLEVTRRKELSINLDRNGADANDAVYSLAFSPDGKYSLTASRGAIRLLEVVGGREVWKINYSGSNSDAIFSKDGGTIALTIKRKNDRNDLSIGDTVKVVEATKGSEMWNYYYGAGVNDMAFNPAGTLLVIASKDNIATVWETSSWKPKAQLKHEGTINAVTFSPDGNYLATASDDRTVRIWWAVQGAPISDLDKGQSSIGQPVSQMAHDERVTKVVFSPDSTHIATASDDNTARLWSLYGTRQGNDYRQREVVRMVHDKAVRDVAFSPDGMSIATASEDRTARVWEPNAGLEIIQSTPEEFASALSIAFSPDGKYLAITHTSGVARIWTINPLRKIAQISHNGNAITDVAFSQDGRYLATSSVDKIARVSEVITGREVAQFLHNDSVNSVAFSPDGDYLATASGGTAHIWNIASREEKRKIGVGAILDGQVLAYVSMVRVAFSPDGKTLATADSASVSTWDVATGNKLRHWYEAIWRRHFYNQVSYVTFSPKGKYLGIARADGIATVFDVDSGSTIKDYIHDGAISGITFSPDENFVATASADQTARVWELLTGQEVARRLHTQGVRNAVFSPDGKYLATTSGTAHVWLWRPKTLMEEACNRLTRNLTLKEWQQYISDIPHRATCSNLPFEKKDISENTPALLKHVK